jgi:hypothetical protein
MSVEDAVRFLEGCGDQTTFEKGDDLLERANAAGYDVTPQDLAAAAEQILSRIKERGELDDEQLDAVAGGKDTIRNKRQMFSSQFENANQKSTQYTNMLASVLKTMNEMQTGIIRNLR